MVLEFSLRQEEKEEEGGVGFQFCLRDVEKGVKWTGKVSSLKS